MTWTYVVLGADDRVLEDPIPVETDLLLHVPIDVVESNWEGGAAHLGSVLVEDLLDILEFSELTFFSLFGVDLPVYGNVHAFTIFSINQLFG